VAELKVWGHMEQSFKLSVQKQKKSKTYINSKILFYMLTQYVYTKEEKEILK